MKKKILSVTAAMLMASALSGFTAFAEDGDTGVFTEGFDTMNVKIGTENPAVTKNSDIEYGGFKFTTDYGLYATITAYVGTDTNVVVPDTLDGYKVRNIEAMAFYNSAAKTIKFETTELTSIPGGMFSGCTEIESVELPEGITYIDDYTFSGCTSLKTVTVPSTCQMIGSMSGVFTNCNNLETVVLKPGTQKAEIAKFAFAGSGIKSISIPSNYTISGNKAFSSCTRLESVNIEAGNLTEIPEETFNECSALESIVIPEGVTLIRGGAFAYCTSLKSVTFPSTCTLIAGEQYQLDYDGYTECTLPAFNGCTVLSEVIFKEGKEKAVIGNGAFWNTDITSLSLPSNYVFSDVYSENGSMTFAHCDKLKSVTIASGEMTVLPENVFCDCEALESVTLPEGLKTIEPGAFYKCPKLKSITIPSTCTEIKSATLNDDSSFGAFENCFGLESVTFKPGTEPASIGNKAFMNTGIRSLVIPGNYTDIGYQAFSHCTDLQTIYFERGTNKVNIEWYAFENCIFLDYVIMHDNIEDAGGGSFTDNGKLIWIFSSSTEGMDYNNAKYKFKYSIINGKAVLTPDILEEVEVGGTAPTVYLPHKLYGYEVQQSKYEQLNAVYTHICIGSDCLLCGEKVKPSVTASADLNSVTLKWGPIPCATEYDVYNYYNGNYTLVDKVYTNNITISNLTSGQKYGFLVRACVNGKLTEFTAADVVYATPDTDVGRFVERLYTTLLGRASDPTGKQNHINRIKNGTSAADIAKIFVLSTELKNKKLTNREFVRRMYVTMLDRNPDAAGLNRWATALDNGCSYGYVLQGFSTSAEFTKLCQSYGITRGTYTSAENRDKNEKLTAYVSRMYTKALNRTYDINGLNNHTGRYLAGTKDAKGIAHDFIFSTEFKNRKLTDDQFIDTMYATFFNRAADAKGKANWQTRMKNGWTREQVFNGFTSSAEFKNLVASFGI
ncbi:MAG: leucine-rich repeat protein [Huintestinicola sp.]